MSYTWKTAIALVIALTATVACEDPSVSREPSPMPTTTGTILRVCTARHVDPSDPQAWLPDPDCTPGSTKGGITSLSQLCPVAHTRSIRPPLSFTSALKWRQLHVYDYPGLATRNPADFEEDHLIPLELGGSPTDEANLWPEPGPTPNRKDGIENRLHEAVCQGTLTLAEAQRRIATDWTKAI